MQAEENKDVTSSSSSSVETEVRPSQKEKGKKPVRKGKKQTEQNPAMKENAVRGKTAQKRAERPPCPFCGHPSPNHAASKCFYRNTQEGGDLELPPSQDQGGLALKPMPPAINGPKQAPRSTAKVSELNAHATYYQLAQAYTPRVPAAREDLIASFKRLGVVPKLKTGPSNSQAMELNTHPIAAGLRSMMTAQALGELVKNGCTEIWSIHGAVRDHVIHKQLAKKAVPRVDAVVKIFQPKITAEDFFRDTPEVPTETVFPLNELGSPYENLGYLAVDVYHLTAQGIVDYLALGNKSKFIWIGHRFNSWADVCEEGSYIRTEKGILFRPDNTLDPYPAHPDMAWIWTDRIFKSPKGYTLVWTVKRTLGSFHMIIFSLAPDVLETNYQPAEGFIQQREIQSYVPYRVEDGHWFAAWRNSVYQWGYDIFSQYSPSWLSCVAYKEKFVVDQQIFNALKETMALRTINAMTVKQTAAKAADLMSTNAKWIQLKKAFPKQFPSLVEKTALAVVYDEISSRGHLLKALSTSNSTAVASYNRTLSEIGSQPVAHSQSLGWGSIIAVAAVIGTAYLTHRLTKNVRPAYADVVGSIVAPIRQVLAQVPSRVQDALHPVLNIAEKQVGTLIPNKLDFVDKVVLTPVMEECMTHIPGWFGNGALGSIIAIEALRMPTLLEGMPNSVVIASIAYNSACHIKRSQLWLPYAILAHASHNFSVWAAQNHRWPYPIQGSVAAHALASYFGSVTPRPQYQSAGFGFKDWKRLWYSEDWKSRTASMDWYGSSSFDPNDSPTPRSIRPSPVEVERDPLMNVQGEWPKAAEEAQEAVWPLFGPPLGVSNHYFFWVMPTSVLGYVPANSFANLRGAVESRLLVPPPLAPPLQELAWDDVLTWEKSLRAWPFARQYPPILSTEADMIAWVERFPDSMHLNRYRAALNQYREQGDYIVEKAVKTTDVMVKTDEMLLKCNYLANTVAVATFKPRLISMVHPLVQLKIGPVVEVITNTMKALTRRDEMFDVFHFYHDSCPDWRFEIEMHLAFGAGLTDVELSVWVDDMIALAHLCEVSSASQVLRTFVAIIGAGDDSLVIIKQPGQPFIFLEGDVRMFDQSQSFGPLALEGEWLEQLGMQEPERVLLDKTFSAPFVVTFKGNTRVRVLHEMRPIRPTGGPDTTLGNTIVILSSLRYAVYHMLAEPEQDRSWHAGEALQREMIRLGFDLKVRVHSRLEDCTFLKGAWYALAVPLVYQGRNLTNFWGPLPSRILKVGKSLKDPRTLLPTKNSRANATAVEVGSYYLTMQAKGLAPFLLPPILHEFVARWQFWKPQWLLTMTDADGIRREIPAIPRKAHQIAPGLSLTVAPVIDMDKAYEFMSRRYSYPVEGIQHCVKNLKFEPYSIEADRFFWAMAQMDYG